VGLIRKASHCGDLRDAVSALAKKRMRTSEALGAHELEGRLSSHLLE
jgi:hypothetical protein